MLEEHEVGKQVLLYERAREEIEAAIMLATSSAKMKEFVAQVCDRLDVDVSEFWEGIDV